MNLLNKPIHILGAGGIGAAVGWALARAGYAVVLVDSHPNKIIEGKKNGVTIVGIGTQAVPFMAFDEWIAPNEGFILLCTKTYNNPEIFARLPEDAFLVPIQNGFDAALERRHHACEGIASFVSECLRGRAETRITRPGTLHIGARRSVTAWEWDEIASLAKALAKTKLFPVELVKDIQPYKATKLMYNAAISPLAAVAGLDNGALLTDLLAKKLFFGMLYENYAILKHAHIKLARIGPFHPDTVSYILRMTALSKLMAIFFQPSLRGTYCSMAPDISVDYCRTEIEAYNGYLIQLAGNFPCPLNRAVLALFERIVSENLKPHRKYLQYLVDSLPEGVLLDSSRR
ncbi:ketopantoate reductase family protein [Nitrosomonas communis]|uniref:ketopantoate reductase family protein n=1 Tax=Nitrosomonas communis TaxID=44574 RepID=UPI003D2E234C